MYKFLAMISLPLKYVMNALLFEDVVQDASGYGLPEGAEEHAAVLDLNDRVLEERTDLRQQETLVVNHVQLLGGRDEEAHSSIPYPHVLWCVRMCVCVCASVYVKGTRTIYF